MTEFRVEYEQRETTKQGYVNGVDTGDPDDPDRTFEPTGKATYWIDDEEVDEATFLAAAGLGDPDVHFRFNPETDQ